MAEFQAILSPIHCINQAQFGIDSPEETGLSFVENALIKARHASSMTNKPALADDSGLVVPALGGSPGILSARYAGEHANDADNIERLLQNLEGNTQRGAFFYCALVLIAHAQDPTPLITCGQLSGVITTKPVGKAGFGYDPIFFLPTHHATLAQLEPHVKNKLSHRAQALEALKLQLKHYQSLGVYG